MLELWFDFSCPYAYLASRKAAALARAAGVTLDWRPMLLGGVFRAIYPASPASAGDAHDRPASPASAGDAHDRPGAGPMATLGPAKAANNALDMHRWAELFGAPFAIPATHPMRTVRALRVLLALPRSRWPGAIEALFAAYWQTGEDLTRDDVIASALRRAGTSDADVTRALRRADDPDIKDELRARTDEAIELGVFGAPAWVVRREGKGPLLIWGQDRMAWVEAVLAGWDPDLAPPPGGPRPFGTAVQGFVSPRTLDIYVDVASPFAYLGLTQAATLAAWCRPRLHPILLGGLFRDLGNVDVPLFGMPPPKRTYTMFEMARWARWWGVPFEMPAKFPQRTITAQRLCLLAARQSDADGIRLGVALGRAMWAEQRDLEHDATLRAILAETGFPATWLEDTHAPAIKQALIDETAAARAAGVFGVPTWIVDGKHLVWGQDRLELVMRMLGGWVPERG